jgi:hypothetical protein
VVDSDGTAGSSGEGKEQKEEEESRRKLAAILEKVEGCVVYVFYVIINTTNVFPKLFLRLLCLAFDVAAFD